ncbi:MAG: PilN domain-containing protein [Nitrospirae bacterium]|nr:PilN domain-containing protein [Nitrospirota bacterium]
MIKINLLSDNRKRKSKGPEDLLRAIIIVNLSALLIAGAVTVWVKSKVGHLGDETTANKTVVETLTRKINEVKKFEKLNKELEEQGKIIETLRKNQAVPVRVLDEVSTLIPGGVWLSSLGFKDNGISLEGNAFSNIDIVSFIDNLKKAPDLSDVYLEESREMEIDRVKVYRFKANFRVRV